MQASRIVMTRDLDSSLLRTFVTVAETGAVGAAASRLARTQAAVSMQLRRLEEDLGQRLLDRSPRGVQLTEAGHLLLPYAHAILGAR
jgi:DNA-binding transcriptional LysR family regulator